MAICLRCNGQTETEVLFHRLDYKKDHPFSIVQKSAVFKTPQIYQIEYDRYERIPVGVCRRCASAILKKRMSAYGCLGSTLQVTAALSILMLAMTAVVPFMEEVERGRVKLIPLILIVIVLLATAVFSLLGIKKIKRKRKEERPRASDHDCLALAKELGEKKFGEIFRKENDCAVYNDRDFQYLLKTGTFKIRQANGLLNTLGRK